MPEIWFTSDRHLGHKNVIEHAKRPFSCVEEMDEIIIQRHNERVRNPDTVYDLGDFAFADHTPYLRRLNGQKHLMPRQSRSFESGEQGGGLGVGREATAHQEPSERGLLGALPLCVAGLDRSHHGAIHLYGHSHGNLPGDSQSCDVGVDCWDFYPVNFDEILDA